MNRKVISLAFATLMGATGQNAFAETPSFNYVQFDYILSGDAEVSEGPFSESYDLQQGFGIQGGFEIGDYLLVMGRHLALDYDLDELLSVGFDNAPISDMTFVGIGAQLPLAEMVSLYGALGFSRPTAFDLSGSGYGLELGARANFDSVTASLWYNMGRTETESDFQDIDIDPTLIGLDVAIAFGPDTPELVLGYVDATNDLDISTIPDDIEVDYDHFSIGIRKTF